MQENSSARQSPSHTYGYSAFSPPFIGKHRGTVRCIPNNSITPYLVHYVGKEVGTDLARVGDYTFNLDGFEIRPGCCDELFGAMRS